MKRVEEEMKRDLKEIAKDIKKKEGIFRSLGKTNVAVRNLYAKMTTAVNEDNWLRDNIVALPIKDITEHLDKLQLLTDTFGKTMVEASWGAEALRVRRRLALSRAEALLVAAFQHEAADKRRLKLVCHAAQKSLEGVAGCSDAWQEVQGHLR
jgi:hypothetical protein